MGDCLMENFRPEIFRVKIGPSACFGHTPAADSDTGRKMRFIIYNNVVPQENDQLPDLAIDF